MMLATFPSYPGGHIGFVEDQFGFAARLRSVLLEAAAQ
jgi:hypothetical protein